MRVGEIIPPIEESQLHPAVPDLYETHLSLLVLTALVLLDALLEQDLHIAFEQPLTSRHLLQMALDFTDPRLGQVLAGFIGFLILGFGPGQFSPRHMLIPRCQSRISLDPGLPALACLLPMLR